MYRGKRKLWLWAFVLILAAGCSAASANNGGQPIQVQLELVDEGLAAPIVLTSPGDGTGRLFVADQVGTIWAIEAGERRAEPFLDLRSRMISLNAGYDERGLLGLALHPQYAENGRFFVYYSAPLRADAPAGWNHTSHLSEFQVSDTDPNIADPASERIVLQVDQPQGNHNGGQIAFGADGYLYVPLGDGGGAADTGVGHPPLGNGQDTSTLLGSILRLDVDGAEPYAIPAGNPFVGEDGQDEIYAYGFRNPFRISFDAGGDHGLYAGDAGQALWEEVDRVVLGGNYGWNIREGTHCFDPNQPGQPPDTCPDTGAGGEPLLPPIIEYGHDLGRAVIGGVIYRGAELIGYQGQYIFGDWSGPSGEGVLMVASPPAAGDGLWTFQPLSLVGAADGGVGGFLLSFGEDTSHELYVLTSQESGPTGNTGRIYRLVPFSAITRQYLPIMFRGL